jgi:hypothetical protein
VGRVRALLGVPRLKVILPAEPDAPTKRLVVLSPGMVQCGGGVVPCPPALTGPPGTAAVSALPPVAQSLLDAGDAELVSHTVALDYAYWTAGGFAPGGGGGGGTPFG